MNYDAAFSAASCSTRTWTRKKETMLFIAVIIRKTYRFAPEETTRSLKLFRLWWDNKPVTSPPPVLLVLDFLIAGTLSSLIVELDCIEVRGWPKVAWKIRLNIGWKSIEFDSRMMAIVPLDPSSSN
jgi:hypothetical protein